MIEIADLRPWHITLIVLFTWGLFQYVTTKKRRFGTINEYPWWKLGAAKLDFLNNTKQLLAEGASKFRDMPFYIDTDFTGIIMLPPDLIDAVNDQHHLSFTKFVEAGNLSKFETFKVMRQPPAGMFDEAVLKGITRALPKYTKPISNEMRVSLEKTWPKSDEWQESDIMADLVKIVARLSNRIFLGEKFSNNEEWLEITGSFTTNVFTAIGITRFFPSLLRPIVDLVSPLNRKVRRQQNRAREILMPVLNERRAIIAKAQEAGVQPSLPEDAIEWFRSASKGQYYEEVNIELGLAVAAIHTTSDLTSQAMLNLAAHPECLPVLREEIVTVLSKHGLAKTALLDMKYLDSFLKETQRLKPISMSALHRRATADVELPRGIKIRKGEFTAISASRMWSADEYPDPDVFQPWRFVERRKQPGLEHRSNLVSTSPEHLGFSHGKHACPGRFFAANEVKIAMLHLILKYDFRLMDLEHMKWKEYGVHLIVNPKARILYRSRPNPEIDIDALTEAL